LLGGTATALVIFIKFNSTSFLAVSPLEEVYDLSGPILLLQEIVFPTVFQRESSGFGDVGASLFRYRD
jgi:hypothetical protein